MAGPDHHDTGHGQRFGGIDFHNSAVGNRRTQQTHMQLERQRHVGHEATGPRYKGHVLEPLDRLSNQHLGSHAVTAVIEPSPDNSGGLPTTRALAIFVETFLSGK